MQKKQYLMRLFLLLAIFFTFAGCGSNSSGLQGSSSSLPTNESNVTITQGIWGNVWFWKGNFMPTAAGSESIHGTITPAIREIYIDRVTTIEEITPYSSGIFYSYIPSELVATTSSDQTGFYQVALTPGTYSVFIKEGPAFYANRFDSQGRVNTVVVLSGTMTKLQLDINYQAAF